MSTFTYLIVDTLTQDVVEEMPFTRVSYSESLNGEGSFSGTLPITTATPDVINKITESVIDATGQFSVIVIRDTVPLYEGIIWDIFPSITDHSLTIGGNGLWSIFGRRYIAEAYSVSGVAGQDVADGLLSRMQAAVGGNLGITFAYSGTSATTVTKAWDYDRLNKYSDAFLYVCDTVGADFRLAVTGTQAAGFGRTFTMYMPTIGSPLVGLEFDTTKNCKLMGCKFQGYNRANRVYATNTAQDKKIIQVASEASDIASTILLESVVSMDGSIDEAQVSAHAHTALQANSLVRASFTVACSGDDVEFGVGRVGIGDTCNLRVSEGWLNWNRLVRVTHISTDVDDAGIGIVKYDLIDARLYSSVA